METNYKALELELETCRSEHARILAELNQELMTAKESFAKLTLQLHQEQQLREDWENQFSAAGRQIEELSTEMAVLRQNSLESTSILSQQLLDARKENEELTQARSHSLDQIADLEARLSTFRTEKASFEQSLATLQRDYTLASAALKRTEDQYATVYFLMM